MTRPLHTWLVFVFSCAVASVALGWVSVELLRLDAAEIDSRRLSAVEEDVVLALWRMDSLLFPLLVQESVRPHFMYEAFYPVEGAYDVSANVFALSGELVPSPLLTYTSSYVRLHFQIDAQGKLSSPQVPLDTMRALSVSNFGNDSGIDLAAARLIEFERLVPRERLIEALSEVGPTWIVADAPPPSPPPQFRKGMEAQVQRSNTELQMRQQALRNAQSANLPINRIWLGPDRQTSFNEDLNLNGILDVGEDLNGNGRLDLAMQATPDVPWPITPLWIGDELVLARRIQINGADVIQGAWADWPAIRAWLIEESKDLLPGVDLVPVKSEAEREATRMLVSLPAKLLPGPIALAPGPTFTPMRVSLTIVWTVVVLAAAGVAMLLLGAMRLSERRGMFVSAVTHELRTPLTTFQMYTEMLSEGMVETEDQRRKYLATLRAESIRLGRLVENVLAYARLERGRRGDRSESVPMAGLIEEFSARVAERLTRARMELRVAIDPDAADLQVRGNRSAIEQILFNLVDNACKYAATAEDRAIDLSLAREGDRAMIRLRDRGPGIPRTLRRRLFKAFTKSAREAAESAPGIGLGLALSRRLARDMGGDLTIDKTVHDGACFVLSLPAR